MTDAQKEIIDLLGDIKAAQGGGGAASFASLTGNPSDNAALGLALDAKQSEAEVQTIADAKVESEAYGPDWNGDTTHAPAKNDVYDKIEDVVASIPAPGVELLATATGVNINTVTPQDVYTVPVGKTLMTLFVAFSDPTGGNFGDGNMAFLQVRESAGGTQMGQVSTDNGLNPANYLVVYLSLTPRTIAAAGTVQVRPDVAYGSAQTCTVRVFGIVF